MKDDKLYRLKRPTIPGAQFHGPFKTAALARDDATGRPIPSDKLDRMLLKMGKQGDPFLTAFGIYGA